MLQDINSCWYTEQTSFSLQQLGFLRHHTCKVSIKQLAHKRLRRKCSKVTAALPASIRLSADGRINLISLSISGVEQLQPGRQAEDGLKDGNSQSSDWPTQTRANSQGPECAFVAIPILTTEQHKDWNSYFSKLKSNQKCKPATA